MTKRSEIQIKLDIARDLINTLTTRDLLDSDLDTYMKIVEASSALHEAIIADIERGRK